MRIAGLNKFSTWDYPDKMCSVIYTAGCNFQCWWCPHPEYIPSDCPHMPEEDVLEFLRNRRGMVEAVVIAGGEPTLQPDLAQFIRACRDIGLSVSLRTNGSNPRTIAGFLSERLVHRVEVEFKAPTAMYEQLAAFHGQAVLDTIELLGRSRCDFAVRTVIRPDITIQDIQEMSREAGEVPQWILLPYARPGAAREDTEKSRLLLPEMMEVLKGSQRSVIAGR